MILSAPTYDRQYSGAETVSITRSMSSRRIRSNRYSELDRVKYHLIPAFADEAAGAAGTDRWSGCVDECGYSVSGLPKRDIIPCA